MIGRIASALAAVAAGVVYAWRTERHANTVKLRPAPSTRDRRITYSYYLDEFDLEQPTEPFPPVDP